MAMDLATLLCLLGSAGAPIVRLPANCAPPPAGRKARSARLRICDARRKSGAPDPIAVVSLQFNPIAQVHAQMLTLNSQMGAGVRVHRTQQTPHRRTDKRTDKMHSGPAVWPASVIIKHWLKWAFEESTFGLRGAAEGNDGAPGQSQRCTLAGSQTHGKSDAPSMAAPLR